MTLTPDPVARSISLSIERLTPELIELRRHIHAHPELAWAERRTTDAIEERLRRAGIETTRLKRSGLVADLGVDHGPVTLLRADIDALPVPDLTLDPWRSTVPGVAHACGHDVHLAALVGAGLALQEVVDADRLPGRVRLVFQPAEEVMPGGALDVIDAGALDEVGHAFALHCDPSLDVGEVGLRVGPLTGAADSVLVRLEGRGGHTSRPHLTQDVTFALGIVLTDLPAALSRRLDPRAGVSMVWGMVRSGVAPNVIPGVGEAAGTVRMLDPSAWAEAQDLVIELVHQLVAPYGVRADVTYIRGVPPVVNEARSTAALADAVELTLGEKGIVATAQSLGGEDFGWFLDQVPGAMGRLGTRSPGGETFDLHQGDLRIDEAAVGIGAQVLAQVAYRSATSR